MQDKVYDNLRFIAKLRAKLEGSVPRDKLLLMMLDPPNMHLAQQLQLDIHACFLYLRNHSNLFDFKYGGIKDSQQTPFKIYEPT